MKLTVHCDQSLIIRRLAPIIYANMPFGSLSACAAGQPSPNGVAAADAVTDVASHEITEAITDPFLNAWFDSSANEIGDLCAYNYGTNTWDGGLLRTSNGTATSTKCSSNSTITPAAAYSLAP